MHKNYLKVISLAFLVLGATAQAQAPSANAPYPVRAPLDRYLIPDEKSEITLARTAAPSSVSDEAEVMVLGRSGYKTAVRVRMAFSASSSDPGAPLPILRTSGIPRSAPLFALIRQPQGPLRLSS